MTAVHSAGPGVPVCDLPVRHQAHHALSGENLVLLRFCAVPSPWRLRAQRTHGGVTVCAGAPRVAVRGRRRQRTADVGYALAVVRCRLSAPGHRSVDQQVEGRSRSSVVARGIWRSCSGAASASSTIWVRAGIWVHIEKICLRRSIGGPGARWPRMWDVHIAFLGADIAKVLGC